MGQLAEMSWWPIWAAAGVLLVLGGSAEANNPLMSMAGNQHHDSTPQQASVSDQHTSPRQTNPLIENFDGGTSERNKPEEATENPSFYGVSEKDAKQMEDQAP